MIQSSQDELGIKFPLKYLQVKVTTLVSLFFITMTPTDCKIANFSLYLLFSKLIVYLSDVECLNFNCLGKTKFLYRKVSSNVVIVYKL